MTHIDPKEAFEAAIQLGLLSADETAENYADNFMYMGTDEKRGHAFNALTDPARYCYTGD